MTPKRWLYFRTIKSPPVSYVLARRKIILLSLILPFRCKFFNSNEMKVFSKFAQISGLQKDLPFTRRQLRTFTLSVVIQMLTACWFAFITSYGIYLGPRYHWFARISHAYFSPITYAANYFAEIIFLDLVGMLTMLVKNLRKELERHCTGFERCLKQYR